MKKFTFKRQLLFVMLMLLGCLSIQAADDGLITNQVVITLDGPGTLPQKMSASDKYRITNLKIKGDINGTDLGFIREMAGQSINGIDETDGKLSTLDLSEAKIVSGGDYYYQDSNDTKYYTKDDELGVCAFSKCWGLKDISLPGDLKSVGDFAFSDCSSLETINLPSGITTIGNYAFDVMYLEPYN